MFLSMPNFMFNFIKVYAKPKSDCLGKQRCTKRYVTVSRACERSRSRACKQSRSRAEHVSRAEQSGAERSRAEQSGAGAEHVSRACEQSM